MLSMVSVGDSYSAGYTRLAGDPAEPDEAGKSGCEQTLGSYPYVLRDELAGRLGRVANVTCGGARTDDILGTPQKPTGHASLDRFGIPQPDPLTPFPLRAPQIVNGIPRGKSSNGVLTPPTTSGERAGNGDAWQDEGGARSRGG